MKRLGLALAALLALAGCAAEEIWAPDDVVARATFVPEGPMTVTLMTAINNTSGSGGHSALLIDGNERILYDPAGTWFHPDVPERHDVLHGMSPAYLDFYTDFHARETFHLVMQTVEISPATAAALIAGVQAQGAQPPANCSRSISQVLANTPGFENVRVTFFPSAMMRRFAEIPGVRTERIFDDDSDNNRELLAAQARERRLAETADALTQ